MEYKRKEILEHSAFKTALAEHIKGWAASGKNRKACLNRSFDAQVEISAALKTPLYDVMMLVRAQAQV